jgi:hypothetical protein
MQPVINEVVSNRDILMIEFKLKDNSLELMGSALIKEITDDPIKLYPLRVITEGPELEEFFSNL